MTNFRTRPFTLTCLVGLAAALAACSSSSPQAAQTTDVTTTPVVLTLGFEDIRATPGGRQIMHFVGQVNDLSEGQVTVDPQWLSTGELSGHWEQRLGTQVSQGDVDLALVATRAFDTLGVDSLRALNAPFLVTTTEMVNEIVTDENMSESLRSGLPDAGVVGIDLWPEGLRHPFGYGAPLLGPTDYEGALLRAPYSETNDAMFDAFGATTTMKDPDQTTQRGSESAYVWTPGGIATGNVTFYPKVNALVINSKVRETLSDLQWDALSQAAAVTRDWVVRTAPDDAEEAAEYFSSGGRIAGADPGQIRDLEKAAAPLTDQLSTDPDTADLVADFQELKGALEAPEPVTSATKTSTWQASSTAPTSSSSPQRGSMTPVSPNEATSTRTVAGGRSFSRMAANLPAEVLHRA